MLAVEGIKAVQEMPIELASEVIGNTVRTFVIFFHPSASFTVFNTNGSNTLRKGHQRHNEGQLSRTLH